MVIVVMVMVMVMAMVIIPVVVVVVVVVVVIVVSGHIDSASVSVHFLSVFVVDVVSNHLYVC